MTSIDTPPQGPQELPKGLMDRTMRLIKARADSLMVPVLDDQGAIVHDALDQKTAMEFAASAFQEATRDKTRKDQFKGYLSGATEELPQGWIADTSAVPSEMSVRRGAMADAAARGRKEHPVQAAIYDYVADPLARAAGGVIDVPVNIGIGALNLVPGVDISPVSTRKAATTLFQFIGNEDKTTWGETRQGVEEMTQAMDDTKGFVGKSAAFAGDLSGTLAGLRSKIAQGVFAPGAKLGEGVVSLGAKAIGKEASKRALGYGAAAGSFAGYDALTARGKDGGKATMADRGEAAMYGALAGTVIQGSSEIAKAAFRSILQRGMGDLGKAEKDSLNGLKKWAMDNKVAPIPRESQQTYMHRVLDTWIDAGAPGLVSKGRQLSAYVAKGTIEGTGLMGLDAMDAHFRSELSDAVFKGDQDAILNVMAKFTGNAFAMTAMHMPIREIAGFQRAQPTRVEPTYQQGPSGIGPEMGPKQVQGVQEQQADAASTKAQGDLQAKVAADRKSVEDQRAYDEAAKTARPVGADLSSPKGPNPTRDAATGTYLSQDLERLGWEPQEPKMPVTGFDPSVTEAQKKQWEVPASEQTGTFHLPGTEFSYDVHGDMARPSPALRETLGLPEEVPAIKLQEALDAASLMSSLQAKALLPGQEISADGMKAEVKDGDAKVRAIRLGEVVEAPLGPEMDWQPAKSFPARGKDAIDQVQSSAVGALTEVLNGRTDMRGRDRALLSSVIEVLDSVAAQRDQAVADMVHHLPDALQGLHTASPEHAGKIVKALAEMLTTKTPEVALDDLVATMKAAEPKGSPEAGFVDIGGAMSDVKTIASGAFEGSREVGKSVYDSVIRDQMTSLSKRSGDRSLEDSMREANTRGATNQAQAMEQFKPGEKILRDNLRRYVEEVETDGGKKPRWIALGEERIAPETPEDAVVAKAIKGTLLELHRQGRDAGSLISVTDPATGKSEIQPLMEPKSAKMPYQRGKDYGDVMGSDPLRKAWWDHLAEQNPQQITKVDPASGRRVTRNRTGEDLEAEHQAEKTTSTFKGTERTAAYEHFRKFPVMDSTWQGHQMLETNPFEAINAVVRQQSGRAGVEKVFGPDLAASVPEADRARLGIDPEKLGGEHRIVEWARKIQAKDREKDEIVKNASDVMVRLQGGEPNKTPQALDTYRRGVGVLRAVKVMVSGIRDIGPMLLDPSAITGNLRVGIKAVMGILKGYGDARQQAEVAGALAHKIGNFDLTEASDPMSRLIDIASWAGNKTERIKTVIFDNTARLLLDNWERGVRNSNDRQLVEKILDFNPAQTERLLSGTAGQALKNQFRQEFVFHAASRGRAVNRSRAASNPYFNAFVAFGNWATKRINSLAKEAKSMSILWEKNATARERMGAMKFATTRATGIVLSGMVGQALMYAFQDFFKGKNGLKRYWRELMSNPGTTIANSTIGEILGGPLGTLWSASTSRPEAVTNLVEPVGMLYQVLNTGLNGATPKALGEKIYDTVGGAAFGSIARQVKDGLTWLGASSAAAKTMQYESDLYAWMRLAGIEGSKGVAKERSAALSGALRSIKHDLYGQTAEGEGAGKATYAAMEAKLQAALGMETGQSLAAAIRGMRTLDVLASDEDRIKFHDHIGEEQYSRMRAHDNMIEDLAQLVGKQHGTQPTAFEDELSIAAKSAIQGDRNAWGTMAKRAVDDAAEMVKLKQPLGNDIRALAERMASTPESLLHDDTFTGENLATLMRPGMSFDRRRALIERMLTERAHAKVRRDSNAEIAEKRKSSRAAPK